MIQSRIVETQDEKTKAFIESVEVSFDGVDVSFYLPGNTEAQALVTALAAVQRHTVNAASKPAPKADPIPAKSWGGEKSTQEP